MPEPTQSAHPQSSQVPDGASAIQTGGSNGESTSMPTSTSAFRSILPTLDSLLSTIHDQSVSPSPPSSVEASEAVAAKARELAAALEEMRRAAMDLPGGHLSEMEIRERCKHLEEIANEQRGLLRDFGKTDMPVVQDLATGQIREESIMPTPTIAED